MQDMPPQKLNKMVAVAFTGRIVLLCFIPSVSCALAGRWIDKRLGFSLPVATLVGLFIALFVVYQLMLREANRYRTLFS
jgi:hypothetical protein